MYASVVSLAGILPGDSILVQAENAAKSHWDYVIVR